MCMLIIWTMLDDSMNVLKKQDFKNFYFHKELCKHRFSHNGHILGKKWSFAFCMLYNVAPVITGKKYALSLQEILQQKMQITPFQDTHSQKYATQAECIKFGGLLWELFPQKLLCIWLLTQKHTFNHGMTTDHRKLPESGNDSKEVSFHRG